MTTPTKGSQMIINAIRSSLDSIMPDLKMTKSFANPPAFISSPSLGATRASITQPTVMKAPVKSTTKSKHRSAQLDVCSSRF